MSHENLAQSVMPGHYNFSQGNTLPHFQSTQTQSNLSVYSYGRNAMNQLPVENSVSLPRVPEGYGIRHLPVHGYFADPSVGNSTLYHPPTYTQAVRVSSPYEQHQLRWVSPYQTIYQTNRYKQQ